MNKHRKLTGALTAALLAMTLALPMTAQAADCTQVCTDGTCITVCTDDTCSGADCNESTCNESTCTGNTCGLAALLSGLCGGGSCNSLPGLLSMLLGGCSK